MPAKADAGGTPPDGAALVFSDTARSTGAKGTSGGCERNDSRMRERPLA